MNHPSISVNKLAEFIVCKSARQREILRVRKYPDPDFNMGAYYTESTNAICEYLSDGAISAEHIDRTIKSLNQKAPEKIGTARRVNSNIGALERFQAMLDDIDLFGASLSVPSSRPKKLIIANLPISVAPEMILRGEKKGKNYVGALKLHMSSSTKYNKESAEYVSAILQEYCRSHLLDGDETVNPEYCFVIDVGNGAVTPGVKSTAQRMKDVAASCENIVGLWPSI